jgi:hypothetical protein
MRWNDVQTTARREGHLVFAMNQGQTAITNEPGPWGNAYSGFCNGCAVRWIALRYGGSDFQFDPKTWEVEMPDWRTTRDQNVYEDASGSFPDDLVPGFAQYGLTLNKGRLTQKSEAATGAILKNAGLAGEGCYYIALRRSGGGHAVAMQNMGAAGGWRFFDANNGEFRAKDDADFVTFIDWYMDATGYDGRYTAATRIIGINPPPYVNATFGSSVKDLIKKYGG